MHNIKPLTRTAVMTCSSVSDMTLGPAALGLGVAGPDVQPSSMRQPASFLDLL